MTQTRSFVTSTTAAARRATTGGTDARDAVVHQAMPSSGSRSTTHAGIR